MARRKDETDMEDIKATLLQLKDQLGDVERDVVSKAKEKVMNAERKVEEKIEKNPISSVGIAFGVGALTGAVAYALLKKK